MKTSKRLNLLLILLGLSGCFTFQPPLSPMQLRALQTREYDASFEDAYKAAITALQDKGMQIDSSDYNGGILHAKTGWQNSFFPQGRFRDVASVTLEPLSPERTLLRISAIRETVHNVPDLQNPAVVTQEHASPNIEQTEYYQAFFQSVQSEVYRRQSLRKARGYQPPVSSQPIYVAPQQHTNP